MPDNADAARSVPASTGTPTAMTLVASGTDDEIDPAVGGERRTDNNGATIVWTRQGAGIEAARGTADP